MKLISSTSLASPKFILWAMVALEYALFFLGATSPALAAGGTNDGVLLVDEKQSPAGLYQFSFAAKAGQTYPIVMSVDLVNWSPLTNVVGLGGPLWFTDLEAPKFRQRFYQIGVPATPTPTNLVFVGPGTFTMGSPESEEGHNSTEGPPTVVTLTRGFWMGKYEVTQEEYVAVTGTNVSWYTSDLKLPAELVSWILATNYCHQLTEKERAAGRLPAGYIYRLPTEAEWEYACRAGRTTPFGIGDGTSLSSTQANFDGTFPYGGAASGQYLSRTTRPGRYEPNAWGLYDMHGNVWEWCQDWFGAYPGGNVTDPKGPATGSERVVRGGGYPSLGKGCRSAERDSRRPGYISVFYGFRVVLARNP
jgi:formylglycine-generating enzyme required for sulfatase activity